LEHLWVAEACCFFLQVEKMGVKEFLAFPGNIGEVFNDFVGD